MDSEFKAFLEMPDLKPRRRYDPFGWAIFLLLLTGFALASWMGSFYVIGHPEDPRCYKILQSMRKIDAPRRFAVTAAPPGKFYTAKELYDSFLTSSAPEIEQKNQELIRDYLRNYADTNTPVPYITGHFTTRGVYELKGPDLFPTGVVAVAGSADCPEVTIEHVYCTQPANIPRVRQMLAANPNIVLERTFDLSAVIHVQKFDDGKLLLTVMPLSYGNYAFRQGISSTFRLEPPANVNLEAGMPLVKPDTMPQAVKMFTLYRTTKGLLAKINSPVLDDPPILTEPHPRVLTAKPPAPIIPASPAAEPAEIVQNVLEPAATPPGIVANLPTVVETHPQAGVPSEPSADSSISVAAPTISTVEARSPQIPKIAEVPATPVISQTTTTKPPQTMEELPKVSGARPAPTPAVGRPIAIVRATPSPTAARKVATLHPPATPKAVLYAASSAGTSRSQPVETPSDYPIERAVAVPPQAPQIAETETTSVAPQFSSSYPGIKLNPFLPSQARRQEQGATSGWRTYTPGQMPKGKLLDWEAIPELAQAGIGGQRYYLRGKYIVTASADNRVILRPQNYDGEPVSSVRVLVDFPAGTQLPAEGVPLARGEWRPFQIVDVRRDENGQINVYTREITTAWSTTNTSSLLRSYHADRARLANQYTQQ